MRDPIAISPDLSDLFDEIVIDLFQREEDTGETSSIDVENRLLGRRLEDRMPDRRSFFLDLVMKSIATVDSKTENRNTMARSSTCMRLRSTDSTSSGPSTSLKMLSLLDHRSMADRSNADRPISA